MRQINKSKDKNALTDFELKYPDSKWRQFRDYPGEEGCLRKPYDLIKEQLFDEQYDLCAYCESDLDKLTTLEHLRRVEHFKSKSGGLDIGENWALDWFNLLGVCLGGQDHKSRQNYQLPQNLSCDSFKEKYERDKKLKGHGKDWNGNVLNPLFLCQEFELFSVKVELGKTLSLVPNTDYCSRVSIIGNNHTTTEELVSKTIEVFNLNCERLSKARYQIFEQFQKALELSRVKKDLKYIKSLVNRWSSHKPFFYQTTRDILISENQVAKQFI